MNVLAQSRDAFLANHPEQRQVVNGRSWGLIRAGKTGPAMLLCPGTLGRADIFWQQIDALKYEARVLSLSYPEAGTIEDWAEDISQLLIFHDLQGATVLGSSLGGYIAQFTAATFPALIGGLVAANTLCSVQSLVKNRPYALDLEHTPIEELRDVWAKGLQRWQQPGHEYAQLAELLLGEVAGRIPELELRTRLRVLKAAPALPPLSLGREKTFTVESSDDHLMTPPIRNALRNKLNPERAFVFTQASHFPYVTRPDEYTGLLREVLGLVPAGSLWPFGSVSTLTVKCGES